MAMNVKKGDTVIVRSGKDKGKQCKVLGTVPSEAKVVVEGINKVTCHIKPRKQGETGGIVEREAALYASKVQVAVSYTHLSSPYGFDNQGKNRTTMKEKPKMAKEMIRIRLKAYDHQDVYKRQE